MHIYIYVYAYTHTYMEENNGLCCILTFDPGKYAIPK